jgi:hypothetical protein
LLQEEGEKRGEVEGDGPAKDVHFSFDNSKQEIEESLV